MSAGESPMRDGVDSLSGVPMQLILQDTQIITNFLHSREIVDELNKRINLRALYSRDRADAFSRLNPKAPIERVVKYWERVSRSTIKLPGGLVKFEVRAFSPQDAKLVADTTLALCEELVNGLNARINRDAVALAQAEFQRATEELTKTLAAEEVARNQSGILETKMSADAISGLVRQLKILAARSLGRLRRAAALYGSRRRADAGVEIAHRRAAAADRQGREPIDHRSRRGRSTRRRPRAIPRCPPR